MTRDPPEEDRECAPRRSGGSGEGAGRSAARAHGGPFPGPSPSTRAASTRWRAWSLSGNAALPYPGLSFSRCASLRGGTTSASGVACSLRCAATFNSNRRLC